MASPNRPGPALLDPSRAPTLALTLGLCAAILAVLAIPALLSGCAGEQVGVSPTGGASLAPGRAGEPAATRAALEAGTTSDGTYVSADGTVTGTYDRATSAFYLVKTENAPLVLRIQDGAWSADATGVPTGAVYRETLQYDDDSESSYEVALEIGPLSSTLTWVTEPDGNMVREEVAELFPDESWTLGYVDRDPDTLVEEDGRGAFVVAPDRSWTGTYDGSWDDGSTLAEELWGVDALDGLSAIHLSYEWRDASTVLPDVDESATLLIDPARDRIDGTRVRYGADGSATCVEIVVEAGSYLELPAECP